MATNPVIQKYYSVTQVAKILGMDRVMVLNFCHARGQKFAMQPSGEGGKWFIDLEKFESFMERRTPGR